MLLIIVLYIKRNDNMNSDQRKIYKHLLELLKSNEEILGELRKIGDDGLPFLTPAYENVVAVIKQFIKNLEAGK